MSEYKIGTFEWALHNMKEGEIVTRKGWGNRNICVFVQFPDEHSVNTEPYIVMKKTANEKSRRFPLDLSCESIFAEDWEIVTID